MVIPAGPPGATPFRVETRVPGGVWEQFGNLVEVGGDRVSRVEREPMVNTVETFAPGEVEHAERNGPRPRPVLKIRYRYLDGDRVPWRTTDPETIVIAVDPGSHATGS